MTTTSGMSVSIEIATDPNVERLLKSAAKALDAVEFDDEIGDIVAMLECGRAVSVDQSTKPWTIRLKPYAELALLEIVDIVRSTGLDRATMQRRIGETLALAGVRRRLGG